ncbi:protein of unknown function [Ferrimonas sediminum]|uniref:DUF4377 domain-containing protein n=1 Tax=Ferrimonas sediminum TaxID=718193 RepID=A0A1G9BZG7_9GAMM|nr:DUF4377 domain-containing protein [Ferrimonas sediminum]SDK44856.1 protein of unknown function [Ferrimonas sediminum]
MHTRIVLLLITSFLIISCDDDNNTSSLETKTLASYKRPCVGVSQQLCFITQDGDVDSYLYDSIEGFDFVWGHTYQLSLKVTKVIDPPADASSIKYSIENIISDIEDPFNTSYEYELVELLDWTFTKESGVYYFLGQPFECQTDVDCDGLVNLNNSGGLVNLTFEYIGNGQITLVQWN